MDYTAILIKEMLFHAKRAAHRINRLNNNDFDLNYIEVNAHYELVKLYGALRSLSMLNLPHDYEKTNKLADRFRNLVEKFYFKLYNDKVTEK